MASRNVLDETLSVSLDESAAPAPGKSTFFSFRTICFDSKGEIQSVFEEMRSDYQWLSDVEQGRPTSGPVCCRR